MQLIVTNTAKSWAASALSEKHPGQEKAQKPQQVLTLLPASFLTLEVYSKKSYFCVLIQREVLTFSQTK